MRLAWHIAWRYLFSWKRVNAINIVSGVSAAAVAVVSAAMICVLSVMNGFGDVIQHMFSQFDPQLKVVATSGTPFRTDAREIRELRACSEVSYLSEVVENTALVRYGDKQTPAQLMGVDSVFARLRLSTRFSPTASSASATKATLSARCWDAAWPVRWA